ncbi:hypothetical protein JVU11DRAFT_5047 [Chiua virens]|nr:hypothetical protein JVU11DRAFT_5047 [Chiua virens]
MRPLTEDESKAVFTKLANYIGNNLIHLIDRKDEPYCFRLHKDKVYYVSESSMRLSISVARPNLVSLGTCFGKFTKTGKFKLHVTALDHIAQYTKYKVFLLVHVPFVSDIYLKVWIKSNGEMPFLYGNHVLKAHLGRITEDTPEHQGVVIFSMSDVPLVNFFSPHFARPCKLTLFQGFGVTARSTVDTRKLDPTAIIVFHQADIGEYLRDEVLAACFPRAITDRFLSGNTLLNCFIIQTSLVQATFRQRPDPFTTPWCSFYTARVTWFRFVLARSIKSSVDW